MDKNIVTTPIWNSKIICCFDIYKKDIYVKNLNKNMTKLNASVFITSNDFNINTSKLVERLNFINYNYLTIFNLSPGIESVNINNLCKQYDKNYLLSRSNRYYSWIDMNFSSFLEFKIKEEFLFNKLFKQKDKSEINRTIFIFNSYPWPLIVAAFYSKDIVISFGSTSRRGILSITHHRLSQFITCCEGTFASKNINESFRGYTPLISQPFFNFTKEDVSLDKILLLFKNLETYIRIKEDYNIYENFIKKDGNFHFESF